MDRGASFPHVNANSCTAPNASATPFNVLETLRTGNPISNAESTTHINLSQQPQHEEKRYGKSSACGHFLTSLFDSPYKLCSQCQQHEKKQKEESFSGDNAGTPGSDQNSGYQDRSTQGHDETLQNRPSPEEWEQVLAGDRQHESDAMLAQAYHSVAEASRDIAIWSNATAVALEEKLAAARREYEAASQVMMATARYQQAVLGIEEAMAHRHKHKSTL